MILHRHVCIVFLLNPPIAIQELPYCSSRAWLTFLKRCYWLVTHECTCRAYLLFLTSWIDKVSSCAGNIYGIFVIRDMKNKYQTCLIFFVIRDKKILVCGDQTTSALEQDNVRMRATSRIIKNNMADQNTDQNHEDDSEDEKILLLVLLFRRRRRRLRAARAPTFLLFLPKPFLQNLYF